MKKQYYVDIHHFSGLGLFMNLSGEYEIVPVGIMIDIMPREDKNDEYKYIENNYGISFIFEDNIPDISFYTVPFVRVFAYDQEGVFVRKDEEICYIREGICLRIASNLNDFIDNIDSWKSHLVLHEDIVVYASKEDALKEMSLLRLE